MATPSIPDFWPMALGASADTVEIPDTTPAGEGIPSFTSLFPILTQIDPTAGGVFIQRTWMNGLFQMLGNNIWYLQHGCLFPWNATFDYPVGAHVLGSDNNEYVAVQESTGQNPTEDETQTYWVPAVTSSEFTDLSSSVSELQTNIAQKAPLPQAKAGLGQWVALNNNEGGNTITLPQKGVWAYHVAGYNLTANGAHSGDIAGVAAGGTVLTVGNSSTEIRGFAWQIAAL